MLDLGCIESGTRILRLFAHGFHEVIPVHLGNPGVILDLRGKKRLPSVRRLLEDENIEELTTGVQGCGGPGGTGSYDNKVVCRHK